MELDYSEPIGIKFFGYQEDLEKLLNRKIDLVTSDGLSKYKILLDSDVVRHFINGNQLLMLTRIFPGSGVFSFTKTRRRIIPSLNTKIVIVTGEQINKLKSAGTSTILRYTCAFTRIFF